MPQGRLGDSKVLSQLVGGPLGQLLVNLNGSKGPTWERAFKRFLRKEECWGAHYAELEELGRTAIPANPGRFHPVDAFEVRGILNVKEVGPVFKQLLEAGVDDGPCLRVAHYGVGGREPTDYNVCAELDLGQGLTLRAIAWLLRQQYDGNDGGPLLVNGSPNFGFVYVKDGIGIDSYNMRISWHWDNGWCIHAHHPSSFPISQNSRLFACVP